MDCLNEYAVILGRVKAIGSDESLLVPNGGRERIEVLSSASGSIPGVANIYRYTDCSESGSWGSSN